METKPTLQADHARQTHRWNHQAGNDRSQAGRTGTALSPRPGVRWRTERMVALTLLMFVVCVCIWIRDWVLLACCRFFFFVLVLVRFLSLSCSCFGDCAVLFSTLRALLLLPHLLPLLFVSRPFFFVFFVNFCFSAWRVLRRLPLQGLWPPPKNNCRKPIAHMDNGGEKSLSTPAPFSAPCYAVMPPRSWQSRLLYLGFVAVVLSGTFFFLFVFVLLSFVPSVMGLQVLGLL